MATYLSIDIDYWAYDFADGDSIVVGSDYTKLLVKKEQAMARMLRYLKKMIKTDISIDEVISHEEMIHYINESKADRLINDDYHSDLSDNCIDGELPKLDEGTWVNHLDIKEDFLWVYPFKRCFSEDLGTCHSIFCPFDRSESKYDPHFCGWEKVSRRLNRLPTKKELSDVCRIGIAISPGWSSESFIQATANILLENKRIVCNKKTMDFLVDTVYEEDNEEVLA